MLQEFENHDITPVSHVLFTAIRNEYNVQVHTKTLCPKNGAGNNVLLDILKHQEILYHQSIVIPTMYK